MITITYIDTVNHFHSIKYCFKIDMMYKYNYNLQYIYVYVFFLIKHYLLLHVFDSVI